MTEHTFDPADWDAFRALAHRMLDDTIDHLAVLREQPAWQEMPPEVRTSFSAPVPTQGIGEAAAYEAFHERVRPYVNGNLHPRFWGWVQGNGTPLAMMAELLAAALNPHMAGFNQAPALVEHEVLRWLAELMGMPDASGILVSGGTMANTIGLAVARHARAGHDMQGRTRRLTFYGSVETHGWAGKAADFIGLGRESFRQVRADNYRIDIDALERTIAADIAAGHEPFCVIGTAGTINTGAIDDLHALGDVCARHDLWYHIDGAFGALAHISPALRERVAGIERADSLGFDLHKWGSMPFECACALVREPQRHTDAFALRASYLNEMTRGVIAGGLPFADRGLELTRGFRALKVWLSLQAYGVEKFAAIVEQNVEQAAYLAQLIAAEPHLELLAPVELNVVCFRYAAPDVADLNALNQELLLRLQERGIAVPSSTMLEGRYALRFANVNHRTRLEDVAALVAAVLEIGAELR